MPKSSEPTTSSTVSQPTTIVPDNSNRYNLVTKDDLRDIRSELRREIWGPWTIIVLILGYIGFGGLKDVGRYIKEQYVQWNKEQIITIIHDFQKENQ